MAIIECAACLTKLRVPDWSEARPLRCPRCQAPVNLPPPATLDVPSLDTTLPLVQPGADPFAGQDVFPAVREALTKELQPGEQVLWLDRPVEDEYRINWTLVGGVM